MGCLVAVHDFEVLGLVGPGEAVPQVVLDGQVAHGTYADAYALEAPEQVGVLARRGVDVVLVEAVDAQQCLSRARHVATGEGAVLAPREEAAHEAVGGQIEGFLDVLQAATAQEQAATNHCGHLTHVQFAREQALGQLGGEAQALACQDVGVAGQADVLLHESGMEQAVAIDEDKPVGLGGHDGAVESQLLAPACVGLRQVLDGIDKGVLADELGHFGVLGILGDDDLEVALRLPGQRVEHCLQERYVVVNGDDEGGLQGFEDFRI